METQLYKFLRIPIPLGTAGAFVWAMASFVQDWDPAAFPDFKTVFALPFMQVYVGIVLFVLLAYYAYVSFNRVRLAILHLHVRLMSRQHPTFGEVVLVPAGEFKFRLTGKKEYLGSYFISKYPVTNEQYAVFAQETGHPLPNSWKNGCYPVQKASHPVSDVTWDDARQYCRWLSGKTGRRVALPMEQQWEKAARGPFGYDYPWGNQFDLERCNVGRGANGETTCVDQYPKGISPYGCMDMCGNVWEWTDSWFDEKREIVVLKGGSYYFDEEFAPSWIRYNDPITDHWSDLGFRYVVGA